MKLVVRIIITAAGTIWYNALMVTLRRGKVIAVESFATVGMAKVIRISSNTIARMMNRSMARRFLGVVQ